MTEAPRFMFQESLPGMCPLEMATARMAESSIEKRGAIFTRREVVDFILNLAGYTVDRPLHEQRLLEPSFGNGDFLLAAVERLLTSWRDSGVSASALKDAVRAVELHHATFQKTRKLLGDLLSREGLTTQIQAVLLDKWLIQGDFLLEALSDNFNYVVGNPPYVRHESIPSVLMMEYRQRFQTIFDRADIYIPFIEKSLSLLSDGGTLGFICADRWMKNRYGGPLRRLVAEHYWLKFYVDMIDTLAFRSNVIAYPAIIVISKGSPGPTRLAHRPEINADSLAVLSKTMLSRGSVDGENVKEINSIVAGAEPWILESFDQLAVVRRFERELPTLEEVGCKVGIGVATGADKCFVAPFDMLDIEADRKLPLVMTHDILSGKVQWRGYGVVNPFNNEGGLVSLGNYPKLRAYLNRHESEIRRRYISRKNPHSWYRTIDRIYPALAEQPKLLIPDIKGEANIVYEGGRFYPHHNLYYITSGEWDLKALQALLKSGIAKLFVATYSTKMRGGYLRFQAQYLRRIRLPFWQDVPGYLRRELAAAAESEDIASRNRAVFQLYGMNRTECLTFQGNGS